MNAQRNAAVDPAYDEPAAQAPLASWYTQGISDGFGDRLLMSDNTSAESLELLRIRHEIAVAPGFERTLRETVTRRYGVEHVAFSRVRAVEYLDSERGLTLVSTHIPGRRLSEIFQSGSRRVAVHPAFVAWLIRWLTPALADLHDNTGDAHGAITPERIVLAPDGRPVLVEHVLGPAIDHLGLTGETLWQLFGIVVPTPPNRIARLNDRTDIFQLASLSLSLLLGRRITPEEHAGDVDVLLDEFSTSAEGRSSSFTPALRLWLELALRTDGHGFRSAREACEGVRTLSHAPRPDMLHLKGRAGAGPFALNGVTPGEDDTDGEGSRSGSRVLPGGLTARGIAGGLGLVVVLQAIAIGMLMSRGQPDPTATVAAVRVESLQEGDVVVVDGQEVGVTPLDLQVGPSTRTISVRSAPSASGPTTDAAPVRDTTRAAAQEPSAPVATAGVAAIPVAGSRPTGFRVVSPIELQVFDGDRQVGSSSGPVMLVSGIHQLDFVNTALGFRSQQTVVVRNGEIRTVNVQVPGGLVSINAVPWAQVWIDGRSVGETPIASLPVAAGEHEIVFRHPELGERRETLVLQSGAEAHVSASLTE